MWAPDPLPVDAAPTCDRRNLGAAELNQVFAKPGIGVTPRIPGIAGGDYPHAYPLPDRRVLWLFQDVFFSQDDDVRDTLTWAAHNAGLIQEGECFTIVGAPGQPAIGAAQTFPLERWFWPLDGEIGYDGALWIFMAEMYNPNRTGAAYGAVPSGTWVARLDPSTLSVLSFNPARDSGTRLYGWSVVSDDTWSYLFGHCNRQFVYDVDGPGQFDLTCMPRSYLARVPVGRFDQPPTYWDGAGWSTNPAAAVSVLTRGTANPMSVQWLGDTFVSVSKVGDWWGPTLVIDRASSPVGPWQRVETRWVVNDGKCGECGTYGAFLMPYLDDAGKMTIALSNGAPLATWQPNASLYRPTFFSIDAPSPSTLDSVPAPTAFAAVAGTAGFEAVDPVRLVDTREAGAAFGRLSPSTIAVLDLRSAMPPDAEAVALNLATTDSDGDGWVRAYPCAGAVPPTSSINPVQGAQVSNAAIVPLGDGRVCVQTLRPTELVVDLNGWLTRSSDVGLRPVTPRRLVDTRSGPGPRRLRAGDVIAVRVADPNAGVEAVALNVTAVDPGLPGYVTAWPCGTPQPLVANLNPQTGVTRPNLVNVRVGVDGQVCLYSSQGTDLVVDLFGEYARGADARYGVVPPTRLVDSRRLDAPRHAADTSFVVAVGAVVAAQLNVTATGTRAPGYLTAYSCMDGPRPLVANVNFGTGETTGNSVLAPGGRGHTCVFPFAPTDVVVDIFGVWTTAR